MLRKITSIRQLLFNNRYLSQNDKIYLFISQVVKGFIIWYFKSLDKSIIISSNIMIDSQLILWQPIVAILNSVLYYRVSEKALLHFLLLIILQILKSSFTVVYTCMFQFIGTITQLILRSFLTLYLLSNLLSLDITYLVYDYLILLPINQEFILMKDTEAIKVNDIFKSLFFNSLASFSLNMCIYFTDNFALQIYFIVQFQTIIFIFHQKNLYFKSNNQKFLNFQKLFFLQLKVFSFWSIKYKSKLLIFNIVSTLYSISIIFQKCLDFNYKPLLNCKNQLQNISKLIQQQHEEYLVKFKQEIINLINYNDQQVVKLKNNIFINYVKICKSNLLLSTNIVSLIQKNESNSTQQSEITVFSDQQYSIKNIEKYKYLQKYQEYRKTAILIYKQNSIINNGQIDLVIQERELEEQFGLILSNPSNKEFVVILQNKIFSKTLIECLIMSFQMVINSIQNSKQYNLKFVNNIKQLSSILKSHQQSDLVMLNKFKSKNIDLVNALINQQKDKKQIIYIDELIKQLVPSIPLVFQGNYIQCSIQTTDAKIQQLYCLIKYISGIIFQIHFIIHIQIQNNTISFKFPQFEQISKQNKYYSSLILLQPLNFNLGLIQDIELLVVPNIQIIECDDISIYQSLVSTIKIFQHNNITKYITIRQNCIYDSQQERISKIMHPITPSQIYNIFK